MRPPSKSRIEDAVTTGCMAVVVSIALVMWLYAHRRGVALVIGGGLVVWAAVQALRRRAPRPNPAPVARTDDSVALAQIKPGPSHTMGLVRADVRRAPLSSATCVFYRVVVRGHRDEVLYEARSADELMLEDGGTRLVVHLDEATWHIERTFEVASSPAAPNERVLELLAERALPADAPVRVLVQWIAPNEVVFVRGFASEQQAPTAGYRTNERGAFTMRASTEQPLAIALRLD